MTLRTSKNIYLPVYVCECFISGEKKSWEWNWISHLPLRVNDTQKICVTGPLWDDFQRWGSNNHPGIRHSVTVRIERSQDFIVYIWAVVVTDKLRLIYRRVRSWLGRHFISYNTKDFYYLFNLNQKPLLSRVNPITY